MIQSWHFLIFPSTIRTYNIDFNAFSHQFVLIFIEKNKPTMMPAWTLTAHALMGCYRLVFHPSIAASPALNTGFQGPSCLWAGLSEGSVVTSKLPTMLQSLSDQLDLFIIRVLHLYSHFFMFNRHPFCKGLDLLRKPSFLHRRDILCF